MIPSMWTECNSVPTLLWASWGQLCVGNLMHFLVSVFPPTNMGQYQLAFYSGKLLPHFLGVVLGLFWLIKLTLVKHAEREKFD